MIKVNKNQVVAFLYVLIFGVSILEMPMMIQFLMIIFFSLIICLLNGIKQSIQKIQLKLIICMIIVFLGCFLIVIYNNIKITDLSNTLITCLIIYIFLFLVFFKESLFKEPKNYLNAISIFMILFSLYYLFMVVIKGLPDDRNSILGYVSSNYCSTLLYINYPLLIYCLSEVKDKKLKIRIMIAMLLSLIVILISGSRTAIGALIIIMLYAMINNNTLKKFIKKTLIFLCVLIVVVYMYQNIPDLKLIIDRGLRILNGSDEVKEDIRSVVWQYTWDHFQGLNNLLGSGSVVIELYQRPAHNFFLEIYAYSGIIGICTYICCSVVAIKNICKINTKKDFYYYICTFLIFICIGYVQPFFSTGIICGLMLWSSLIVFQKIRSVL